MSVASLLLKQAERQVQNAEKYKMQTSTKAAQNENS